jgi:hypothetical protein
MAEPNMDQPVDGQGKVFIDPGWSPLRCEKLVTFTGGTTDAWGDDGGARDGGVLFTVTGTVRVRIMGVVETTLVGGATANVGTSKDVAGLLPQVADTSGMAINETWHMTDGTVDSSTELASVATEKTVVNGLDILFYNGTANITSGAIRFLVSWYPVSADGNVTPSTI